jgi:hypothetical protein
MAKKVVKKLGKVATQKTTPKPAIKNPITIKEVKSNTVSKSRASKTGKKAKSI